MGHGDYSSSDRAIQALSAGYNNKSADQIFASKLDQEMDPRGITLREARDSDDHPESVPVIIGLDVTGSMGKIPHQMVQKGLPHMMDKIITNGVPHPQLLFMGIGDHECDQAPLQVGQFESGDQLLDKWLTTLWIEGRGGANDGESYLLAWYFAHKYTKHDALDKRNDRGVLFTIGDEPTLDILPVASQKKIMGDGKYKIINAKSILEKAKEKYEIFHLHILQGHNGMNKSIQEGWKELLGDNAIMVEDHTKVAEIIADKVLEFGEVSGFSIPEDSK